MGYRTKSVCDFTPLSIRLFVVGTVISMYSQKVNSVCCLIIRHIDDSALSKRSCVERLFPNSSIVISRRKSEYVIRHAESSLIHIKA